MQKPHHPSSPPCDPLALRVVSPDMWELFCTIELFESAAGVTPLLRLAVCSPRILERRSCFLLAASFPSNAAADKRCPDRVMAGSLATLAVA